MDNEKRPEHVAGPAPTCPLCGAIMRSRKSKRGLRFWGCSRYPQCRGTRELEDVPADDDEIESLAEREARQAEELDWRD
jgi:ssDNA-binding Zn-finger/Zn-ribbon topoisomerase 1